MAISKSGTVALIANGVIHDWSKLLPLVTQHESIVAVDGGLVYCDQMGVMPAKIVGDMDSVPLPLLEKYSHIPQKKYLCEKDFTDLELAIEEVYHPSIEKISLFGAVEGRMDHFFFNIQLLRRHPGVLVMETENESSFVVDRPLEIEIKPGQILSLLPLGDDIKVSTSGLKWELKDAILSYARDGVMSLSNIALRDRVKIEALTGQILCTIQRG